MIVNIVCASLKSPSPQVHPSLFPKVSKHLFVPTNPFTYFYQLNDFPLPTNTNVRIVQLIDSLEAGGAERMAVNYANALVNQIAFSGLVVTRKEGGLREFVDQEVVYLFLNKKGNFDFKALFSFRKYCLRNKITHIHAHSSSFFWATLIKISIPKIKVIWHDHYGNSEFLNKRSINVLKAASFFFCLIIVVNEKLFFWVKKKLLCKEVVFLNNFPEIIEERNGITQLNGVKGKRILYLANLRSQKNHELLLEIAKVLKKTNPEWTFHLVGKDFNDAYAAKIKNKIISLNLETNVYLYGSQDDVSNIISQSTFGILTSLSEGLPVSLLEFGTMGKTVIATNVGDISSVVQNGTTGILIENFSKGAFCEAIEKLINDETYREILEKNIKTHVEKHFSKEAIIKQYIKQINCFE